MVTGSANQNGDSSQCLGNKSANHVRIQDGGFGKVFQLASTAKHIFSNFHISEKDSDHLI